MTIEDLQKNIVALFLRIGADQSVCKGCGVPIWWLKHSNGNLAPYTINALNHFTDCKKAESFRKKGKEA